MTNDEIIRNQQRELLRDGKLKLIIVDGRSMIEPIHTRRGWKDRGYRVKKGEKSTIRFVIWRRPKSKIVRTEAEEFAEVIDPASMKLEKAQFFKLSQVEKLAVPTSSRAMKMARAWLRRR